jgi:hypothetical protein
VNNRELATLIWLGIVLVWACSRDEIRTSLGAVVKSFVHPYVLGPVLALAGWTVGLAALAHKAGLWEEDVRNDTVVWFVTVGIGFYMSMGDVAKDGFFRKALKRAVGATVFVEVFLNLAVFPLPVELVLLPVLTLLTMLAVISESKSEYALAHRLVNGVLSLLGIGFFVYVSVRLIGDLDADHTMRALALPVWLTLGAVPLIYVVGLWSAYQLAFIRIGFAAEDARHRRRAKRALVWGANVRAANVGGLAGHWIHDLASAESAKEARRVMRTCRKSWREEQREHRMNTARDFLEEWVSQSDDALADIHHSALCRTWEDLDSVQRATLKMEAEAMALNGKAELLAQLPD